MKEIKELRKRREKHFLNNNGTITAYMYDRDVHYRKNGKWEDIDNTLVDKGGYYRNSSNDFNAIFTKKSKDLVNIVKDEYFLRMTYKDANKLDLVKKDEIISYKVVDNDITFTYKLQDNKLKENIILGCKETIPNSLDFIVNTNLFLKKKGNKVLAVNKNNETIFTIDSLFMFDSSKKYNYNLNYVIDEYIDGYIVKIELDKEWLKDKNTVFPVTVDPTIINGTGENVYDTSISTDRPDYSYNNSTYLRTGVEENGTFRTLLKFELPEINPACTIVNAIAYLKTMAEQIYWVLPGPITVHNITIPWDEETATWNSMNDKYDEFVESYCYPAGHFPGDNEDVYSEINLTNIVKKWYAGLPNNGVLLKVANEVYDPELSYYVAYSKSYDYQNGTANRPYLIITYLYQNGILPYIDYNNIDFSTGNSKINNWNGNITNAFRLNNVKSSQLSFYVSAIYNNCDVILENEYGLGKGWKLNFDEQLEFDTIDEQEVIKYSDEFNSIHYFYNIDGVYCDEEGLQLKIKAENSNYTLTDAVGNKKIFELISGKYKLTKIIDLAENEIEITYNNEKIVSVKNGIDAINITYQTDKVVLTGEYDTATVNLNSNKQITSIQNKFGIVSFEYDNNNLINKITDINNTYIKYQYHNSNPYRVEKVSSYDTINNLIKELSYNYGYNSTSIVDNNSVKKIYSFNNNGNTIGVAVYDSETNNLKESYGFSQFYDNSGNEMNSYNVGQKNIMIKYINNIIKDSSFENSDINVGNGTRVQENSNTGNYACKFQNEFTYSHLITKSDYYTFSFYIKTSYNGTIELYKKIDNNQLIELDIKDMRFNSSDEYQRYFITGYFDANTELFVKILLNNENEPNRIGYIDDLQLETGKIANSYNLLTNSNFSDGSNGWSLDNGCEIITIANNDKAIKINGSITGSIGIGQNINITGNEGDIYNLSFWYKNEGVIENPGGFVGNMASVAFIPQDELYGTEPASIGLNMHSTEWQFFNATFVADTDYKYINIGVLSSEEANSLYVTDFMLIKDLDCYAFSYDENGNTTAKYDISGNITYNTFDKNNQMSSSSDKKGNLYRYEYDNVVTNRLIRAFSPGGLTIEYKYNDDGNKIKEIISGNKTEFDLTNNSNYYVRLKGTELYLHYDFESKKIIAKKNECNNHSFKLLKINDNDYKMQFANKNVIYGQDNLSISNIENNYSLFNIIKNSNGSITIIPKEYPEQAVSFSNNTLMLSGLTENESNQQFYFENVGTYQNINTSFVYNQEGKNIVKYKDFLDNETDYTYENGLNTKIIKPNGAIINNLYNDKDLIIKKSLNNREINYEYNNANQISKITLPNKVFSFIYDELLREKEVRLNNNTLLSKEYDSNSNITKVSFSNGNQTNYTYDKFNRVSSITNDGKKHNYYYNNTGALSKIETNSETYDYVYDFSQELKQLIINNEILFSYDYDDNNNLINRTIIDNNNQLEIQFEYDEDDNQINTIIDQNINIHTCYDSLKRVISEDINNLHPTEIRYLSKGENTSPIVKSFKIGNDLYEFSYDNCYNITKIYLNNTLIHKYEYDEINELTLEINYNSSEKIKYKYDDNGNLLSKTTYGLDGTYLYKDSFEYSNSEWKDQLTKYNDTTITYDSFGNPTTFGNQTFTWTNGTQLKTYSDGSKTISFEYNDQKKLIKKIDGENVTNYYYDNDLLTIEKSNNYVIYYIYNNIGKLIGFKFNNQLYFYQKNNLNDIIGIYDNQYNLIVKYNYDSWGNIISIINSQENEIADSTNIGLINPFRYRGYFFDKDTQLYVLKSRYYNPKICRFINIDSQICEDFLGANLYLYCSNNPITRNDDDGNGFLSSIFAGAIAGAVIKTVVKVASNAIQGEKLTKGVGEAFIEGAVTGALAVGLKFIGFGTKLSLVGASAAVSAAKSSYSEGKKYGSGEKELSAENIAKSSLIVAKDVVVDTGLAILGDSVGSSALKELGIINSGREATKFLTLLVGKKAMKNHFKDIISEAYGEVVGSLMDFIDSVNQSTLFELF